MKDTIREFLDIAVPRFITEDVAANKIGDTWQPICCVKDLEEYDIYDEIITVRTFNFFGFGLFPKLVVKQ